MKNFVKKILYTLIIATLFFYIGVKAEGGYSSDEIYYSTTGTSVTKELDNLQTIKKDLTNLKSQGNATAVNILTNKSAVVGGTLINGSMTDRGAWISTPTGSGNTTIPAGYHNGNGYVNTSTVYTNGYNAGAASVTPTQVVNDFKSQTLSQGAGRLDVDNYTTLTFTFTNLSKVVGITYAYGSDGNKTRAAVRITSISGNSVTVGVVNSCWDGPSSPTITLTAIGY